MDAQTQVNEPIQTVDSQNSSDQKNLKLPSPKYFLLVLLFLLTLLIVFQYVKFSKPQDSPSNPKSPEVCIQVITPARNPKTRECKDFPTPCDVPRDWIKVPACTINQEEGKLCGGIAGEKGEFACPTGYFCKYPKPMYPDAQGKCTKTGNQEL